MFLGISSRWEFIQGEIAMQKKFVSTSRSSASRNYRKKLQKRLMHHKQQLQDLEQAKKSLHSPSQVKILGLKFTESFDYKFHTSKILLKAHSILSSQTANFSSKLEAAFKSQERFYKKTMKQHSVKHLKEILGIRRSDLHALRGSRSQPPSGSR